MTFSEFLELMVENKLNFKFLDSSGIEKTEKRDFKFIITLQPDGNYNAWINTSYRHSIWCNNANLAFDNLSVLF